MLRLIVHLGAAKCGSSALQLYFANNCAALKRNGVLIPGPNIEIAPAVDATSYGISRISSRSTPSSAQAFTASLPTFAITPWPKG